ncbi:hypothetical protein TeGR_g3382, partial [Tetraparma gracilis]
YEPDAAPSPGEKPAGDTSEDAAEEAELEYEHFTFRQKLYLFLEDETSGRLSFLFGNLITLVILLSILQIMVETLDGPNHYEWEGGDTTLARYSSLPSNKTYDVTEAIFSALFTVELIMRLFASSSYFFLPPDHEPTPFDEMVGEQ